VANGLVHVAEGLAVFRGQDDQRVVGEAARAQPVEQAPELLVHLAQCEVVFGSRVRMALTHDGYVVQPFDQDAWLLREAGADGREAFWAYYAMRHLNLQLFSTLSPEDRRRPLVHPERGPMIVEWILESLAGHERHHLPHFQIIAGS
jgi:hypothetical protein